MEDEYLKKIKNLEKVNRDLQNRCKLLGTYLVAINDKVYDLYQDIKSLPEIKEILKLAVKYIKEVELESKKSTGNNISTNGYSLKLCQNGDLIIYHDFSRFTTLNFSATSLKILKILVEKHTTDESTALDSKGVISLLELKTRVYGKEYLSKDINSAITNIKKRFTKNGFPSLLEHKNRQIRLNIGNGFVMII